MINKNRIIINNNNYNNSYSLVHIVQNTEKSLKNQIPIKDHQLTLVGKIRTDNDNNNNNNSNN